MSRRLKILVVTPTLGESRFLDATMASVQALPLEILHVLSAPAPRLRALAQRFPQATVVADAGKAGGIYGALNAALVQVPDGWDWFTYINDDDTLLPGFGEVVCCHLRDRSPEPVIYGDVDLIDEESRILTRVSIERNPLWIPALLQQGISPLMQQGTLFARETIRFLDGFDTRYRLCADLDFWLRAYAAGARFRYYPRRLAQFRIRSGQLSGHTLTTRREQAEIVQRLIPKPEPRLVQNLARWRYRWCNLPRYLARVRSRGFRTSYQLLEGNGAHP
jgi:hypothetical protein